MQAVRVAEAPVNLGRRAGSMARDNLLVHHFGGENAPPKAPVGLATRGFFFFLKYLHGSDPGCYEAGVRRRPFSILGIQQIAVGARDKAALHRLWVDLLGLAIAGNFRGEQENVDEDIAVVGSGSLRVEVDLMQPIDPEKRPRVHEPPLNHIGLWVDDLRAAVEWLAEQGVRFAPGGIRRGAAGFDVCFIHPRGDASAPVGGEGVLIELVQAPADVIAAFRRLSSS